MGLLSLTTVVNGAIALTAGYLVYWVGWCIYCVTLHPLAKYPGPRLAAVSELWYAWLWCSGRYSYILQAAHEKYGDVVRIAPGELSFASVQAFKDIYGPATKTRKLFTKGEMFYDIGTPTNITYERDPVVHARRKERLTPGFRTQALRDQEHVIHENVDLLMDQLILWSKESDEGVDITKALEWLTFDITGVLVFGETFGAVKEGRSHYWVSILLSFLYSSSLFSLRKRIPLIIVPLIIAPIFSKSARDTIKSLKQHSDLTLEKVRKRAEMGDMGTRDLLWPIIQSGEMTDKEIAAEATVLLTGGAETTATTLTAGIWHLSQNPEVLRKLQREIRGTFKSYDDITGDSTAKLPYLNATIEEIMRLFPPVAGGGPRRSPGDTVDGEFIPEGVFVSAHIWYIHRDPRNAPRPLAFEPERWLDGAPEPKPFTSAFLIGPRACIGVNLAWLEMRVTLAKLVHRFDWSLVHDPAFNWVDECQMLVLWKKPALKMRFRPAEPVK
ncbi:putative cytochrome P450 [Xylariales sp. PMI_506]|nr:putative cytochrome P450 [Xylariales sp. PMI_506]